MNTRDRHVMVAGLLLHAALYCVLLVLVCCGNSVNPTELPPPTEPTPLSGATCDLASGGGFTSWHGIVPGRTLPDEVMDVLGQPDNIVSYLGVLAYHYYPQTARCAFVTVVIDAGVVQSVTEVVAAGSTLGDRLAALTEAGCEPLVVQQTISQRAVYAYPEMGVAFEVTEEQSVLVEHHFAPVGRADYLGQWSGTDLRLDPSRNRALMLEWFSIRPGVTVGEARSALQVGSTIAGVRLIREVTGQSRGGLNVLGYYLCPAERCPDPLEQKAQLALKDGRVYTMELELEGTAPDPADGRYPTGLSGYELYTLGDALRDFGEPGLAFVTEQGGQVWGVRLVYPDVGRQVLVDTATSETHTRRLSLNSPVASIMYFAPESAEEFRSQSAQLWHNDYPSMRAHREVEWDGVRQFCR